MALMWVYIKEKYYKYRIWIKLYRWRSLLLFLFSCSEAWCTVHQLLDHGCPHKCHVHPDPTSATKDDYYCNQDYHKDNQNCDHNTQSCKLFDDFRSSQTSECSAVAVAGTLFASIAIASMSLPSASQAHWVARALWLSGCVFGLTSVLHACKQQRTISRLLDRKGLWCWMFDYSYSLNAVGHKCQPLCSPGHQPQCFHVPDPFAVLLLSGPRKLMHCALWAYLIGIGVYLGFVWEISLNAEAAEGDNRNIFIFFVVSLAVCLATYLTSEMTNSCKNSGWGCDFDLLFPEERRKPRVGRRDQKSEIVVDPETANVPPF